MPDTTAAERSSPEAPLRTPQDFNRLQAENARLSRLVDQLGLHLTALCDHPENWEPCPGCYDARDAYRSHVALQSQDPKVSPLGDRREQAVLCGRCRRPTWNIVPLCDRCREDQS